MAIFTRRDFLAHAGAGLGSIGLASLMNDQRLLADTDNPLAPRAPHFSAKAKHVIHLYMNGGPSQVDTFDPKPSLTTYQGQRPPAANLVTERRTGALMPSPFPFRKHGQSGIEISSIFPHLSAHADKLCVLRSMYTDIPNHDPAMLLLTSGVMQPTRPCFGSWMLYGLGSENQNLPGFIALCPGRPGVVGPQLWNNSFLPGIYQGTFVNNRGLTPRNAIPHIENPFLSRDAQRDQIDLIRAMNDQHRTSRPGDASLEGRIQAMEMAFRMQFEAQDAFDLSTETVATRTLYGSGDFNNGCLLARRLVERGVRVVQLYFGAGENWDDHDDIRRHASRASMVDQPIAALLQDLESRGLLDETLIVWGGEFGRTPTSEGATGRDHNPYGFTTWLAGGGVKGGMTYGATDEFGFAAVDKRTHVHDLHATMLHLMGLDHERLTYRYSGRDFRLTDVAGHVIREIIA